MKFPQFEYVAPDSVGEAVSLLARSDGAAKILAGGQSLLPMMAFRLANPEKLIDIRKLTSLTNVALTPEGTILGARVRWRDIENDLRLESANPLLRAAIKHTAHYQIRNRGTVGGSLAHADPAAEMPGIAVTCDAEITATGPQGDRVLAASDFFLGPLSTQLRPDELLVHAKLPAWKVGRRWAFQEFARRRGDFAIAGIAVYYDTDALDRVVDAHVGVIGACTRPHRVAAAEEALNGRVINSTVVEAASKALRHSIEPSGDLHA